MPENPYSAPANETIETSAGQGRRRLVPVAIALLVVSIAWIFLLLFGIAYFFMASGAADIDPEIRHVQLSYMLYMAISALYALLLATGALSMLRCGSYAWAATVNCLALIPLLGPCYVAAIPVGIWGLWVLSKPDVRASFQKL